MIKLHAVCYFQNFLVVFYCVLNKNFKSNVLNTPSFMNTVHGSDGFALTHNSLQLSRGAQNLYSDDMQLHFQEKMNSASSHMQPLKLLVLKLPVCTLFRYNNALSHFHTLLN